MTIHLNERPPNRVHDTAWLFLILAMALLTVFAVGCNVDLTPEYRWDPAPEREDLRACNQARAGTNGGNGDYHYEQCMLSMGYRLRRVQ
jgi:hypothetical protein